MAKMGSREKEILKRARDNKHVLSSSDHKKKFKNLDDKGWLEMVDYGKFKITEEGEKALQKRLEEDLEEEVGSKLGDFDD